MKRLLSILFLFLTFNTSHALSGEEWLHASYSPVSSGLGYSGIADTQYGGSFLQNPAATAASRRIKLFGTWGIADSNRISLLGAALPVSLGVFNLSYQNLSFSEEFGSASRLKLGFSKSLSENLLFGFSAGILNYAGTNSVSMGFSADLGVIYSFEDFKGSGAFGLYNSSVGLSVIGLGKAVRLSDGSRIPGTGIIIGAQSDFLKNSWLTLTAQFDLNAEILPGLYYFNGGLQVSLFDYFNFRGGFITGSEGYGSGTGVKAFTLGASIAYDFGGTPAELIYSYNPYTLASGTDEAVHFLGTEIAIGTIDESGPVCSLSIGGETEYSFSPNYDGARDKVTFDISVQDKSLIESWTLSIYNKNGKEVQSFTGVVDRELKADFSEVWARLWAPNTGIDVPETQVFNGTTKLGYILDDGKYTAVLTAEDEYNNTGISETNVLFVDTESPTAVLSISDELFSPNGDGIKDSVTISQTLSSDSWTAEIRNNDGKKVMGWTWTNDNAPAELEWDGTGYHGVALSSGSYDYLIYGTDDAGNKTVEMIEGIHLTTDTKSVFLTLSDTTISPNGDGIFDQLKVTPAFSDTTGLSTWLFRVFDSYGNTVHSISGKSVPESVLWDGLAYGGESVPDGDYFCLFSAEFESGDEPVSEAYQISVDTTEPSVSLGYTPELFSPDGDGDDDTMTFKLGMSDESGISNWTMRILDSSGKLFKTFSGVGDPAESFTWDGYSDEGALVSSASEYEVRITASDALGNSLENESLGFFDVDVLVEETERGYKIRINNIEFDNGEAVLSGLSYAILDRVSEILERYDSYSVEIHGHADSSEASDDLTALSLERAEAVRNYLTYVGISASRLTVIGFGDSEPIDNGLTEAARKNNRRVEFILIKK